MFRIPTNGIFAQPNKGDIFGNLFRTQNIDLKTAPGRVRVSPRLTVLTKDDDGGISGLGVPLAFVTHAKSSTKLYYAACGDHSGSIGTGKMMVSSGASITSGFINDATVNTPVTISDQWSDMVEWRNLLYVSTVPGITEIAELGSSWDVTWYRLTRSGTAVTTQVPAVLCPAFNGNLYIGAYDKLTYVPVSGNAVNSGTGTIDFLGQYVITWIRSSSNRIWIGLMSATTVTGTDAKGYVAEWDGTGTAANRIYDIGAPCALSCEILDDVPHIIDAYGRLKKFNNGFTEVARLPVANLNIEMPGIYNGLTVSRWIHQRGMSLVDGKINIAVNNFVSTGIYVDEMPSGTWEYEPGVGLYHKESPCATSSDFGQQSILTAGALYGSKRSTATYLAGFAYYLDDVTTSHNAIFYDDIATNTNKRGSFITTFLSSENILDQWHKVAYRFKQLPSGDKIIGKYRSMKKVSLPFIASIIWTSTTTFTSADANFQYASVGDEIEVVMGKGASTTAHISVISSLAGTYTVTLEDAIGFSSGTGKAKVNNFSKMGVISNQNSNQEDLTPNSTDTKIQIKTEFRVTGDFELDDLTLLNTKQK